MSGLFSAAFLRQNGWDVDVYERSSVELVGRGAGLVVHPSAGHADHDTCVVHGGTRVVDGGACVVLRDTPVVQGPHIVCYCHAFIPGG